MSLATSYAAALFETTQEKGGDAATIEAELLGMKKLLADNQNLRTMLLSPAVSLAEKSAVVAAVAKAAQLSTGATQFLGLLAKKNRLSALTEILSAHEDLRAKRAGGLRGHVKSADALSASDLAEIESVMKKKFGRPVSLVAEVDPSLIAGLSVTVGGVTYDGSIRAQLERARAALVTG